MSWRSDRAEGPAGELHARVWGVGRSYTWCDVTAPAVVLGSVQPASVVDPNRAAAAGVSVARRSSGGGAVLLEPGRVVWVDVVVPIGDPLWDRDVGRAFWWLGDVWAAAFTGLGVARATVHRGPLVRTAWSAAVCFAGLGPGEVTVDGRKVVGISQRRVRAGALFQCACLLEWDPRPLVDVLDLGGDGNDRSTTARAAVTELDPVAVGLARLLPGIDAAAVEVAFASALTVV